MTTSYDLPVQHIMQRDIVSCLPDISVREAAGIMSRKRVSSVLVVDGQGIPLGIWTEHDALRLDFGDEHLLDQPVANVMSCPVLTVLPDTSIGQVALRFKTNGVRHYLVVDDAGLPLGVVGQSDVVRNQGLEFFVMLRDVSSVLRGLPAAVPAGQLVRDAVAAIRKAHGDALIVEYEDGYGIITERDIVHAISDGRLQQTVGELASRPLITIPDDSSLLLARNHFLEKSIRHLGVVAEGGQLAGLVTFGDILASIEHDYVQQLQNTLREQQRELDYSRQSLALAEKVFESSPQGIMITDTGGAVESVNPAFSRITGYSAEEARGRTGAMLQSGRHGKEFYRGLWGDLQRTGHWQGEIWNRRKNGEIYPEWLTITVVRNTSGDPIHYIGMFNDITERKEAEDRLRHLAHHDPLTRLPNRSLFVEHLGHAVAHAHRSGKVTAVMFLDLDHFKSINDTLGHGIGDLLLVTVAERLRACVREDDTVSRLGGDEFTILLEDLDDVSAVAGIAEKIITVISEPMMLGGHEVGTSVSVGISVYPHDADNTQDILHAADAAMYQAKQQGRNNYRFFTSDMNTRALQRRLMENSLRQSLERGEFELYYQPQVDLASRRITGMEALLRWCHPELGVVSPSQFIPVAEETGLIVPIGEWVIRTACNQNKLWQEGGFPRLKVAVNLSSRQFHQRNLVARIGEILEETGLEPCYLELEITERVAMENIEETVDKLEQLKTLGVFISLEDFGTSHSSLGHLRRFRLDTLKMDKSFLRSHANSHDAAVTSTIADLAQRLKLRLVSEGVESGDQIANLGHAGGDGQGYYFSHPLTAGEFERILRQGPTLTPKA